MLDRYLRMMADGEAQSEIRLEDMGMIKLPSVLQDFKKMTLISLKGNRIADVSCYHFVFPAPPSDPFPRHLPFWSDDSFGLTCESG